VVQVAMSNYMRDIDSKDIQQSKEQPRLKDRRADKENEDK